jgi:hypothetical protein
MAKQKKTGTFIKDQDILSQKFCKKSVLTTAKQLLSTDEDISEEVFLGAQGVLLLNGLL